MLPQEIKEMNPDQEILFVEHVLPIKCRKIRYFTDPIFSKRLLPAPGVSARDASNYQGGRTDDHFRMWEERLQSPGGSRHRVSPTADPVPPSLEKVSPADEFSLDFSQVRIPKGRYLSEGEIDSAVNAFLNELESA